MIRLVGQSPVRLVYVAGPYTSDSAWGTEQNIRAAEERAAQLLQVCDNLMPVIPHSNTRGYFQSFGCADFWYHGTIELMRRCDAVLTFGEWVKSNGAVREVTEACALGIPVFHTTASILAWASLKNDQPPANDR